MCQTQRNSVPYNMSADTTIEDTTFEDTTFADIKTQHDIIGTAIDKQVVASDEKMATTRAREDMALAGACIAMRVEIAKIDDDLKNNKTAFVDLDARSALDRRQIYEHLDKCCENDRVLAEYLVRCERRYAECKKLCDSRIYLTTRRYVLALQ